MGIICKRSRNPTCGTDPVDNGINDLPAVCCLNIISHTPQTTSHILHSGGQGLPRGGGLPNRCRLRGEIIPQKPHHRLWRNHTLRTHDHWHRGYRLRHGNPHTTRSHTRCCTGCGGSTVDGGQTMSKHILLQAKTLHRRPQTTRQALNNPAQPLRHTPRRPRTRHQHPRMLPTQLIQTRNTSKRF